MKRFTIFFTKVLTIFLILAMIACNKDDNSDNTGRTDPNKNVPDPKGTVPISMRTSVGGSTTYLKPCGSNYNIYVGSDDNFIGGAWLLSSIGKVNGLGNITKVPTDANWVDKVAATPGHGYVAVNINKQNNSVNYIRMFVVDYIISASGGVIGAEVKYQCPFNEDTKAINLSQTKLELSSDDTDGHEITVSPNLSWRVTSDAQWAHISISSANAFIIKLDTNESTESRSATITVSCEGLPNTTVNIIQKATGPVLSASEENIHFTSPDATNKYIDVYSNTTWTATSNATWCTVTPVNGGKDGNSTTPITINVSNNIDTKNRNAKIVIKGKGIEKVISITQDKYVINFTLSTKQINFSNTGGSQSIVVSSNVQWTATSDAAWCTITPVTDSGFHKSAIINVAKHMNLQSRQAKITIKGREVGEVITVIQDKYTPPVPAISVSPTSLNFSCNAESKNITVNSNERWTATSNTSWCTVTPATDSGNYKVVTIAVIASNSNDDRIAQITINSTNASGLATQVIQVTQESVEFAGGTGKEGDPYQIKSARQLNNLRKYLGTANNGKQFILMNDIDLTNFLKNTTEGWEPIGYYNTYNNYNPFCGYLNGNNYKIKGLWINRPSTAYVGLFGYTTSAIIENIGVEILLSRNITGLYAGGMIGLAGSGKLSKCYVNGTIIGAANTGGLIGTANNVTIKECYTIMNIGNITNYNITNVGGLIGVANTATITQSYANTIINLETTSSTGTCYIGGLIGSGNGTIISNSYTTGSIYADLPNYIIGGFFGYITPTNCNISNSYASNTLSGRTFNATYSIRGFIGKTNGTFNSSKCYYDKDISKITSDASSAIGKATAEMKKKATYAGWDFNTIWAIDEGQSYPYLR